MTEPMQLYRCEVCGIVVETIEGGAGEPVCCGRPMTLLVAKSEDSAREKHVPFIERTPEGVTVRVGQNAAHPMEPKHFIQWIQLQSGNVTISKRLEPGDPPAVTFPPLEGPLRALELCNIHGLWTS
jgi:superoxide reductase